MRSNRALFLTLVIFIHTIAAKNTAPSSALVAIKAIDPSIIIDLRYATADNFTGKQIYPKTAQASLVRPAAESLRSIQHELHQQGLSLKIWDAYRPLSAQKIFWEIMPDARYVAPPTKGSRHNRASAVDVTLISLKDGKELEMPSAFDDFSEKAHRSYENASATAIHNRKLLENIMVRHGWEPMPYEWWHFDYKGWQDYPILAIEFE